VSGYGRHPDPKQVVAFAQSRRCSPLDAAWLGEHVHSCTQCGRIYRAAHVGPMLLAPRELPEAPVALPVAIPVHVRTKNRSPRADKRIMNDELQGAVKVPLRTRDSDVPRIAIFLLDSALNLLSAAQRERYEEEWKADLHVIKGKWRKIRWAVMVRFYSARALRRLRRRGRVRL
jgi:hypothetical protein